MSVFSFLQSAVSECEEAPSGGTPWFFWVIVGALAFGLVILFIQNFIIKKEEDYK